MGKIPLWPRSSIEVDQPAMRLRQHEKKSPAGAGLKFSGK